MTGVSRLAIFAAAVALGAVLVSSAWAATSRRATLSQTFDPFAGGVMTPVGSGDLLPPGQGGIVNVPVRPPFRPPIRSPFTP